MLRRAPRNTASGAGTTDRAPSAGLAQAALFGALVQLLLILGVPRPAVAQGAVGGQISIVERAGSATQDLTEAVVYLVSDNDPRPSPAAGSADAERIAMRTKEFQPRVRVVPIGGAVAFPNHDPFSHNVFSNAALGSFDLGLYRLGASRSATFSEAGVYPIYCNIHARMVAFVVAVPTRYYGQPDRAGRFVLRGVPAGGYTLHVWHERAGEITRPLAVPVSGVADLRIALDASAYTQTSHPNKFGGAYASMRADRY